MSLAAPTAPSSRWFFGPGVDLLFGCGLVYCVFFVFQAAAGPTMREWAPAHLLPFLILALGAPHYGATLLRVYGKREDRVRYRLFAVYVSAALLALYVAGLQWALLGSLLVTLYFTWSPWHYSGQNYGLAVLFLRRRGVAIDPTTKRLLYSTFLISYAAIFLVLHTQGSDTQYAPATYEGTIYSFFYLGIPTVVRNVGVPLLVGAYASCLLGAAWRLRATPWRDLLPSLSLVGLQCLWFLAPAAGTLWGGSGWVEPLSPRYRAYTFMWIAVGHFVQYLWITTYYAASSQAASGRAAFLVKALLVGNAIWTVPALVFAPGVAGRLPFDLGLGLLTASVVNIHHFILDGAIWKLRDGRVARALLRPVVPTQPAHHVGERRGSRILAAVLWGAGAVVVLAAFQTQYEYVIANRSDSSPERFRSALERLDWLGRSSPYLHIRQARRAFQARDLNGTLFELEQARALYPTKELWMAYGAVYEHKADWVAAGDAYEKAISLSEEHVQAWLALARVQERLGEPERALATLERAASLAPEDAIVREVLESRRRRAQDP
jgi:hypothetical protein